MKRLLMLVAGLGLAGSLTAAAVSCETGDLLHRWSFNGSLADACGGNTARIDGSGEWNDADHPTALVLPGGAFGAGAVDLGYNCGSTSGELTLEIWCRQDRVCSWSRLFDWGWNGGNFMALCWTEGTNLNADRVILTGGGTSFCSKNNSMSPYALGVQYHISMRLVQRLNGGVDMKWQKRDASSGTVLAEGAYGMDNEWSVAKLNDWQFCLGRAHNSQTDNDPAATYDEVRVWKKALSDEQLAWSARLGPDTLPTDEGNATISKVSVSVVGSGRVAVNGGEAAANVSLEVARNAAVTLVASPAEGFLFRRWLVDAHRIVEGSATETRATLDASRDASVVAEFVPVGEPTTAVWIGTAGNGDPADAANWQCRNVAGAVLSGVCPTARTVIVLEGEVNLNCPIGVSLHYESLVVRNCRLTGDCDWRGLGAFSIEGIVNLAGHVLRVARLDGTGKVTSLVPWVVDTTVAVPDVVANSASFWLDAADTATLAYNDRGEVATWTSKDASHVVATSQGTERGPVDGTALWGFPTVDFGDYASTCDLVYPRFTNLRTVFWVIKLARVDTSTTTEGQYNFLLGDKNNGNGVYNFHGGVDGVYGDSRWAKFAEVWNGTQVVNWRTDMVPDQDFQVITATMSVDSCSDSISQDRDKDRNGGRQLSELICFNTVLSAEDRTNVVQYLERKWRRAPAASPGTLVLDVPAGETIATKLEIGGYLNFVKEGPGTYFAGRKQTYLGSTELVRGTTVAGMAGTSGLFGDKKNCLLTVDANAVFDSNGFVGMYQNVLNGGTIVNNGALCDGSGPFVNVKLNADAFFDCTRKGFGFWCPFVDLGGHVLDVSTGNTTDAFFSINNTVNSSYPVQTLTNGTVRVHGEGEMKIWSSLDARTADFDLDCPLWMCWTTTVHNLTYRYTRQNNELEDVNFGEFHVVGTFNPVSSAFVRTMMLNGSTLDLSGKTGTWSTLGTRQGRTNSGALLGECVFEPNGTVTIDVHGRTFAAGERIVAWSTPPQNVTFQWDDATRAANPEVVPFVAADGIYFGFDANVVSGARWTGEAGDGNWANPVNWACVNANGDVVANALPNAQTTVRLTGEVALNIPVGTTQLCAVLELENVKLTGDCDWRGYAGSLVVKGVVDLQGHRLWLSAAPQGKGGQIVSSYGFDSELAVPPVVTGEACFWLDAADASTLTVDDDGRVSAWRSKGTAQVTAAVTNAVMRPAWMPYDYGRPCVDFGATGSKQDLVYPRFTQLRTVFWVIKIPKSGMKGFLLGDSEAYHFHRGEKSQYGDSRWAQFATVWNGTDVVDWANDLIPDDDFQIISATMGVDGWSNSLTQDRKDTSRSGGRQLSELICFERVLGDAERTAITQYLQQKWGGKIGANGIGELHLSVPAGENQVSRETRFTGLLKVVKEGEGTFTAGCRGQGYLCGTETVEGALSALRSPDSNLTLYNGTNGMCFGAGTNIVVGAGTTFDFKGNHDYGLWTIQLDGGTLRNSGRDMRSDWGGLVKVEVTADSRFVCDFQTVIYNGATSVVGLNGRQLTAELNAPLWLRQTIVSNGTLRLVGTAPMVVPAASDWRTVDLVAEAPLEISAALDVRDYIAAYTGDGNAGSGTINVYGTFCPVANDFARCVLQSGATLDLSGRTGTFSDGNGTMQFTPESTIVVDIHGRALAAGEKLVAWSVPPVGVSFSWDSTSAANTALTPVVRGDGLYSGGETDQVVIDAVWTDEAGDGDIAKPVNWTCRNAAGQIVEGGLPCPHTLVHISGTVAVDFPAGNAFTCRELDMGSVKLARDCDWRGLQLPAGVKIDLDGHKLYLSDLPASGSATCTLFSEDGNAVGEPAILGEACFWLDAAYKPSLVLDANNKVQRWTSRDPIHYVAIPSGNSPTYNTTLWAGRPTVDFGSVNSKCDLGYERLTNLQTVFLVAKMQKHKYAFILGDTTSYDFHRGDGCQYVASQWANVESIWNGTTAVNPGSEVIPDSSFQFLTVTMKTPSASNRITQDRNFADRNGGKQLSELICFNRLLTDAERITVTEYLQNKWLNGASHRGELHLDVPAGKTVANTGFVMEKSVRFFKDGEGSYLAICANQSHLGGNEVTGGAVFARQLGTKYVLGPWDSELLLHAGTVFDLEGQNDFAVLKIVMDGGTIRNSGGDLADKASLGKIVLTDDSQIDATRSLSTWWDGHYLDLGGHTLSIAIGIGKTFSIGANTTLVRNGTLDFTTGGYFRVFHGALDASTVSLRTRCAIDIADTAGTLTVKDYVASYPYNYNIGTNVIKVLDTFMPAAGAYFHGCELVDGTTLDLSEQTGTWSVKGAFSSGANEMRFAPDAMSIHVVIGDRPLPSTGKIVDWTGRAPANLSEMKFSVDDASRRRGRRLVVANDGLYVTSGGIIILR